MNITFSFRNRALRLGAYACVMLLLASFVSCKKGTPGSGGGSSEGGTPVEGDWVIVHELADAETLNLITSTDNTSQEIFSYMYEQLTSTDPYTLQTIPWIADSVAKMSDDKLSYEFRLKKNVTFSDGVPVTGEDFIFYLKSIKNPLIANAAGQRSYFTSIDRIELIDGDKYHIRAVMNAPYYLGDQIVGGMYAFPKHVWDPENVSDKISWDALNKGDTADAGIKKMAEFIQDVQKGFDKKYLVASGPYMFDEFQRNQKLVVARNPHYWNKDNKFGKAYPEKLVYRTINDPNAAVAALKSQELDFMPLMEKVNYNREKNHFPDYKLKGAEYDFPAYSYIGYNELRPIFKDKLVRQALARAIDRESIIKTVYFGLASPVQSPILNKRPEYDSTIPTIKYDLAKAKELLTQAGWTDSDGNGILDKVIDGKKTEFTFSILLNSGNKRREQIALIFIDALKSLGIRATTTSLEWATFLERTRNADYDAYVGGWALNPTEGDMYQIWHSKSAVQGGSNIVKYKSPQVDSLIEAIRGEFDFSKRKEMYMRIQQIINEDQPYNFLVTEKMTGAYSDRFHNVEFFAPRPCYNNGWWWAPKDAQKYTGSKAVASSN